MAQGPQIDTARFLAWLRVFYGFLTEQKDYLNGLDAAIGDADHGANLHRGFSAVLSKEGELASKDPASVFKATAMTLISTVGGASGPLYGTLFLQAAASGGSTSTWSLDDFEKALSKGMEGVIARGKAAPGDKTLIDALKPALETLRQELSLGHYEEALPAAAAAAEEGALQTQPMLARKGRASYLGDRSIGHQDPGATSVALLFKAAARALTS